MLQIRLNNKYMDVKIRSGYELTLGFIDSDLPFLMNWVNKTRDPITGMVNRKINFVEDIHFIRELDNRFLSTKGILRNCYIKEIDFENMIFIIRFDFMDNNYNPIDDRNKKIKKIQERLC